MAKKFAGISGLHNIFELKERTVGEEQQMYYDISGEFLNRDVNKNTVCFITADSDDVDLYIADHKIQARDRFIVVQNDVYSLYGSLENPESISENTWRPLYINGDSVTFIDYSGITPSEPYNLNFEDSVYIKVKSKYNESETLKQLSISYDFDFTEILNYIQEHIVIPTPPTPEIPSVYDGELSFVLPKEKVHTDNPTEVDEQEQPIKNIDIQQNTIDVAVNEPTEEVVKGSFSANSPDNKTVTIRYKGTADRVDWFVENEVRNIEDENNSDAKKFVYIECLQEYFDPSLNYPYIKLKKSAESIISEDSIVFITCGQVVTGEGADRRVISDAEVFGNPEYYPGARYIWTHNMMFSANTWLPIFTRETEYSQLKGITPPIGTNPYGGRLIFQGKGGITVENSTNDDYINGVHDRIITIDGSDITGGSGSSITLPITADNVIVKRDIPIQNTFLAQGVINDGTFSEYGNKIPAGMSLQEVLERLLYKEITETWGNPVANYYLSFSGIKPVLTIVRDDTQETINVNTIAEIPVGTTITITVDKRNYTRDQYVTITGYPGAQGGGYKKESGPIVYSSTFTESFKSIMPSPDWLGNNEVWNEDIQSIVGFERVTDNTLASNQIRLRVKSNSGNNDSITFYNQATQNSANFNEYTVYPISNKGNLPPESTIDSLKKIVGPTYFTPVTDLRDNRKFQIKPILPFYAGFIGPFSEVIDPFNPSTDYFSSVISGNVANPTVASNATKALLRQNTVNATTEILMTPSETFKDENDQIPSTLVQPSEMVIFAPKNKFSVGVENVNEWLNVKETAMGSDWTKINTATFKSYWGETILNGDTYYVWYLVPQYEGAVIRRGNVFKITFKHLV